MPLATSPDEGGNQRSLEAIVGHQRPGSGCHVTELLGLMREAIRGGSRCHVTELLGRWQQSFGERVVRRVAALLCLIRLPRARKRGHVLLIGRYDLA